MAKKVWATIILIYLIFFGLNFFTPLCFGDDYVYAFIWPNQSMYIPLPETVERISGFGDVLLSQRFHYLTGNGRFPAHFLVQFFIWNGKQLFNILNSAIFVLLILEIYWVSNKGEVSLKNLHAGTLWAIFFFLWAFTVNFPDVYLWLSGACNYLWMLSILLSLIILYVRKYFNMDTIIIKSSFAKYLFFIWGIGAGWTNENTVCWLILILGLWILYNRKQPGIEPWMWYGLAGLCIGYMFLILAPGNMARSDYYANVNIWSWQFMKSKLITLGLIEFFEVFLWYFILTSLKKIKISVMDNAAITVSVLRQLTLLKVFCFASLMCNCIMLLSPEFPARSGFASLVLLIIAVFLLISIQSYIKIKLIDDYAKKFLAVVSVSFFLVTLGLTYSGMHSIYLYYNDVEEMTKKHVASNSLSVLEIPAPPDYLDKLVPASFYHIIYPQLSNNEKNWKNVAYARYYKISGIRIKK